MEKVYERCCGLDVHKKTVVACPRVPGTRGPRTREVRTFGTTTPELLALADWLLQAGGPHVAIEATGGSWQPVCNSLEGVCEVRLGTAHHITAGPGRKTDVKDCEGIADLLEHGLLRARRALIAQRAPEANRVQTCLEPATSTLGSVAADVLGTSGRRMLKALLAGERDGARLAELAKGPLRKQRAALAPALTGRFTAHHAFLLGPLRAPRDELEAHSAQYDAQIEEVVRPFAQVPLARLQTIPGVGQRTAEVILAEIGVDMRWFPTAAHLASWAGRCPGNHERAGTRKRGTTRTGPRPPHGPHRGRVGGVPQPSHGPRDQRDKECDVGNDHVRHPFTSHCSSSKATGPTLSLADVPTFGSAKLTVPAYPPTLLEPLALHQFITSANPPPNGLGQVFWARRLVLGFEYLLTYSGSWGGPLLQTKTRTPSQAELCPRGR